MQRVCGLCHVKYLVLDILNTQLGVEPTFHPHLIDLAEKDVHICLQQVQAASDHCLMLAQRSDQTGPLHPVVLNGIWRFTIMLHHVGLQQCNRLVLCYGACM